MILKLAKLRKTTQTNYIVITGGVISSVGKGVLTSSIGALLEAQGYNVTAMKIDPYINLDSGTMRPTEHGEVYVTNDGFETDQDLGNYERFTNINTTRDHSLTTGQIYQKVINDERAGRYKGKCVEVIPHIPMEVIRRIKKVAKKTQAEFVLIEIGATAGEYQIFPFLDAIRRMKFMGEKVIVMHAGYLPIPSTVGEQKSKPLQRSIVDLRSCGVDPNFIVGRSKKPLDKERIEKIALNCSIKPQNIISAYDESLLYKIPINLRKQNLDINILAELGIPYKRTNLFNQWEEMVKKIQNLEQEINIGVIGKYFNIGNFSLEDSYISVIEATKHGCWHSGYKPKISWINSAEFEKDEKNLSSLDSLDAIIIPGGFGESGVEGKILAIQYARENKIPYLGLCYGLQLAIVEYARNVCGLEEAHTTEINPETPHPVIDILPEQKSKLAREDFGGSMRLGSYDAELKEESLVQKLYGEKKVSERHRHRREVNKAYVKKLKKKGMIMSGKNKAKNLVEFVELPTETHPFFVATQAHPEFKSRFLKPHPLFRGLAEAAAHKKKYK